MAFLLAVNSSYFFVFFKLALISSTILVSSFNNSKINDFNTALALLLNGNAAACKTTIDGLNPDELKWNHYYLRAVAAARSNNADDVAANLIKAIGANSEVRNMAKSDMEFAKMFSNPLFQGAIR